MMKRTIKPGNRRRRRIALQRTRGAQDLRKLVGRLTKDYSPKELNWGPPVGREVW